MGIIGVMHYGRDQEAQNTRELPLLEQTDGALKQNKNKNTTPAA